MQNNKAHIDIVNEVLEHCIIAFPVSSFIISLYKQYQQRGSLSKKQLQGLHSKASTIKEMPAAKLATLEAIIKKMPSRFKSEMPEKKPLFEKDESIGLLIENILSRYPQHKRVLFLRSKYESNELSISENEELKKFQRILK